MSEHIPIVVPHPSEQLQAQILPPEQEPPAQVVTPASPEQTRAVHAVFAQQEEKSQLANFLGLWTGAMLLKDMAVDALHESEEEDEEEKNRHDPEEDGDPMNPV
jgi:hypothetical protein